MKNLTLMQANASDYREYYQFFNTFERKHAPSNLFLEGNASLLFGNYKRVSVVGSRKATSEALQRAKLLTEELVKLGIVVVSGLAEGIDTVAHLTAITNNGSTIAVLGTPLSETFPKQNESLLQEIKKNHLAVSQFAEGVRVYPSNFPARNRTMALISDATIIVEAGEKSGTLHQGWEALRLGRILFIMEEVVNTKNLTWTAEMIKYGAQVLKVKDLPEILQNIPNFTSAVNYA